MPALQQRREDIPELVAYFLERLKERHGRAKRLRIGDDAMAAMQTYDWPGNVRQLRNVLERIIILSSSGDDPVSIDALPVELREEPAKNMSIDNNLSIVTSPLREARETFEREYLRIQIRRFSGNISRTATFVGMERSALHRKLKSLGLTTNMREKEHGE